MEIKDIIKNLSSDAYTYMENNNMLSIASGSTLIGNLNLNPDVDVNSLPPYNDIEMPALPELSAEEIALNEIMAAVDYMEEKYFENGYIDYVIEHSAIVNKSVKTTYLYNENYGGAGIRREML